jgi:hypothetical protein
VDEDGEKFIGIINYSVLALIQPRLECCKWIIVKIGRNNAFVWWKIQLTKTLMENKSHDYGAWREMRVSSLTDLILQKFGA